MLSQVWNDIEYPFPNFNGCIIEVYKWISNFIGHFAIGEITYPCPRFCIDDVRWTGPCLSMSSDFQLHGIIGPCSNKILLWLTHWGRDKMGAIFQTTFSNAFSWMKMFEFRFKFHWSLFPRVQLTILQHWFRLWLGAVQATSHCLNQSMMVSLQTHICITRPQWFNVLTVIIAMSSSGAFLLTRFNFNPSMTRSPAQRWNEIEYPFLNNHWSLGMHK